MLTRRAERFLRRGRPEQGLDTRTPRVGRLPPLNLQKAQSGFSLLNQLLPLLQQLNPLHCAFMGDTGWTQPGVSRERSHLRTCPRGISDTLGRTTHGLPTSTACPYCPSTLAKIQCRSAAISSASPPTPARAGTRLSSCPPAGRAQQAAEAGGKRKAAVA